MGQWTAVQSIWGASLLVVAGLVVWRGDWEERTVIFGLIVDTVGLAALQNAQENLDKLGGGLILGIIYLIVLAWVALRSGKGWPLWTAASQLVGVGFFMARMADPMIGATALAIWSYLILIAVGIGTLEGSGRSAAPPSPSERVGP